MKLKIFICFLVGMIAFSIGCYTQTTQKITDMTKGVPSDSTQFASTDDSTGTYVPRRIYWTDMLEYIDELDSLSIIYYFIAPQGTDISAWTGEGRLGWDTDDDQLKVGTGSTQITVGDTTDNVRKFKFNPDLSGHGDYSGIYVTVTAGETLYFNDTVYEGQNHKFYMSDTDTTDKLPAVGMALETIPQDSTGDILLYGFVKDTSWTWTDTTGFARTLWADTAVGGLTQTKPDTDYVQQVASLWLEDVLYIYPKGVESNPNGGIGEDSPYPRLGVFQWGGACPTFYAQFDLIVATYTDTDFVNEVLAINDTCMFLWSTDVNAGAGISNFPSEWWARDTAGNKIEIYGGLQYLADITEYCDTPSSGDYAGLQYNDYLVTYYLNKVDLTVFGGLASDGSWTTPYDIDNIDLDGNGDNDYTEHGEAWITAEWSSGADSAYTAIYDSLSQINKVLHLNSGGFHEKWWDVHNGMTFENSAWEYNFQSSKNNYNNWVDQAPYPHTLLTDANFANDDWNRMRYRLGSTLYGDGYFSYATDGSHYYDKLYDEYELNLGSPVDDMFEIYDYGGYSGRGVYVRFFENGVVILNVDDSTSTFYKADLDTCSDYDGPYYYFRGNQDTVRNSGLAFGDSIQLEGEEGPSSSLCGDAVILMESPDTSITPIIIDTNMWTTTEPSDSIILHGNFTGVTDEDSGYTAGDRASKGTYSYQIADHDTGWAEIKVTMNTEGYYDIYEWHPSQDDTVMVVISAPKGGELFQDSTQVNQNENPSQWNFLWRAWIENGNPSNFYIRQKYGGVVDAYRFVWHSRNYD